MLSKGTKAYVYRDRQKEFRKFFTIDEENSLVFCSDVKGLVDELKPNTYKNEEWRQTERMAEENGVSFRDEEHHPQPAMILQIFCYHLFISSLVS